MRAFRVLNEQRLQPGTSAEASHTVASSDAKGVTLITTGGADGDIRFSVTGTADANSQPLEDGVYLTLLLNTGGSISVFNTTGAQRDVHIIEWR